jgi:dTDP-4-amino-4,6-dideoxygalactose transaminase
MKVPFNIPYVLGTESEAIVAAISSKRLCGGGAFGTLCEAQLQSLLPGAKVLMTTSCTDAMEICAALLDIQPGDEIIAPSFTFVTSVSPFVSRGASIRFVDVDFPSLNVSSETIESAITPATRAVIAVHYGGGAADVAAIRKVCDQHGVILIEDAAQSLLASYHGQALGTFGHLAAMSFHETKNVQCGEGGAIIINDESYFERAEIIREKGTDRSKFIRGQVDKYSWIDNGSSHIPSELNSAFLSEQLKQVVSITSRRISVWEKYRAACDEFGLKYVRFSSEVLNNAHVFGVFADSLETRTRSIAKLGEEGIQATFHYVPLHSSVMGKKHGVFHGVDRNTTIYSDRLIRLPLYPTLDMSIVDRSVAVLANAFNK